MASLSNIRKALQWDRLGEPARRRRLIELGLLAAVLAVAILMAPHMLDSRFRITWDGSFYLSEARYLLDGQGYVVEPDAVRLGRPPGFVALLATTFLASGPTVSAAMWLVRFAGLAAVITIAAMSYRMFGAAVALVVIIWVATNEFFTEYFARVLLLDITQTALMLAFIWLVYEAATRGSLRIYALAATALAAAFWVKESVLLLAPLPLLATLINHSWHTRRHFQGFLVYGLTSALLVAPWFAFVFLESGTFYRADSAANADLLPAVALAAGAGGVLVVWMWRWHRKWVDYLLAAAAKPTVRTVLGWCGALALVGLATVAAGVPGPEDISRHFTERVSEVDLRPLGYLGPALWVILPLGWLFTIWKAFHRSPADVVLIAALLVSIPVAAFVADRNLAPRNYLLVLMLTHLVLGRAAVVLALWTWNALKSRGRVTSSVLTDAAAGVAVGLSLLLPVQMTARTWAYTDQPSIAGGQTTISQARIVDQWVRENLPQGERVHVLASPGGGVLRFLLGDDYQAPWVRMEWMHQQDLEAGLKGDLPGLNSDNRPYRGLSGVVFINVNQSPFVGDRETERPEFQVIQVPDLVTGEMPRYLVWINAEARRVFPEVMPEFLLNSGLATELREVKNGTWVMRLPQDTLPNILLVNEVALDDLDGARDGAVRLSPGLAEALRGWKQLIIIDAENTGGPTQRELCDDIRSAVPGIECWDGLLEYPATGRNVGPFSLEMVPEMVTADSGQRMEVAAVYHDSNGAEDLRRTYLMINREWDTNGACYLQYNQEENQLYIHDDGWIPAGTPGSGEPVGTPPCTLDPASTSVTVEGNRLKVLFNLQFSQEFVGSYLAWLGSEDREGVWSSRREVGSVEVRPGVTN